MSTVAIFAMKRAVLGCPGFIGRVTNFGFDVRSGRRECSRTVRNYPSWLGLQSSVGSLVRKNKTYYGSLWNIVGGAGAPRRSIHFKDTRGNRTRPEKPPYLTPG